MPNIVIKVRDRAPDEGSHAGHVAMTREGIFECGRGFIDRGDAGTVGE